MVEDKKEVRSDKLQVSPGHTQLSYFRRSFFQQITLNFLVGFSNKGSGNLY